MNCALLWPFQPLRSKLPISDSRLPTEEITTGAAAMIADGVLKRCPPRRIHALHVNPQLPCGTIGWKSGVMCAAADLFDMEIQGFGVHAARPHHCIDVVLVACQMIQALHLVPSRCIDPLHHPRFAIDDRALAIGVQALAALALEEESMANRGMS